MEPVVVCLILMNTVLVVMDAGANGQSWVGWLLLECILVLFFAVELALKCCYFGVLRFFTGSQGRWNCFDTLLFLVAVAGVSNVSVSTVRLYNFTILRVVHLAKLGMHVTRAFEAAWAQDAHLLLRGLLDGLRCLCCIYCLVLASIFIFAVLATDAFRETGDTELRDVFSSVPMSMFTTFRCMHGMCATRSGRPIITALNEEFGALYSIPWFGFVTFFIVCVVCPIISLCVVNMLRNMKAEDHEQSLTRSRESVRVAKLSTRLMHKLSRAAIRTGGSTFSESDDDAESSHSNDVQVTRDAFLVAIQDRAVQRLMDALDIQPDRAHLFDLLDAKMNGTVAPEDLVVGLLRMRGSVQRSDTLASLWAVRSLQELVKEQTRCMAQMASKWESMDDSRLVGPRPTEIPSQGLLTSVLSFVDGVALNQPSGRDRDMCIELGASSSS